MADDTYTATAKDLSSGDLQGGAQKALNDALAAAQRTITDAARSAEKALKDGADALRVQTREYRENAGQRLDEAQQYVVERIKERPVEAALAGLGVGVLIGLLLSNRGR